MVFAKELRASMAADDVRSAEAEPLVDAIARLIEPKSWKKKGVPGQDSSAQGHRRVSSIRKARAIVTLIYERGYMIVGGPLKD